MSKYDILEARTREELVALVRNSGGTAQGGVSVVHWEEPNINGKIHHFLYTQAIDYPEKVAKILKTEITAPTNTAITREVARLAQKQQKRR